MAGRAKVPEELERMTKSQRLTVIDEAALGFERRFPKRGRDWNGSLRGAP